MEAEERSGQVSSLIDARGLTRRFGDFVAVGGIDVSVGSGEVFGLLGANGAGKTTAIRMLCGTLTPTAGTIMVAGQDMANHARRARERIHWAINHLSLLQNRQPPLELVTRAWFNPNLDDRYYFVPGIMANVVLIATMILMAMTVVREQEHGTLERLMVTPLAKLEFIVAKLIPVALIGLFDVILITLVAVYLFDVPFRGSFLALVVSTMLYLMSTLGMGLLISSYASTQQQAMLTAFFFLMPMVILSGFAFPIRNMPEWIQYVTYLDPLRYYLVVVRDLFLKGGGLASHPFQFGMMGLLGSTALGLSLFRLR